MQEARLAFAADVRAITERVMCARDMCLLEAAASRGHDGLHGLRLIGQLNPPWMVWEELAAAHGAREAFKRLAAALEQTRVARSHALAQTLASEVSARRGRHGGQRPARMLARADVGAVDGSTFRLVRPFCSRLPPCARSSATCARTCPSRVPSRHLHATNARARRQCHCLARDSRSRRRHVDFSRCSPHCPPKLSAMAGRALSSCHRSCSSGCTQDRAVPATQGTSIGTLGRSIIGARSQSCCTSIQNGTLPLAAAFASIRAPPTPPPRHQWAWLPSTWRRSRAAWCSSPRPRSTTRCSRALAAQSGLPLRFGSSSEMMQPDPGRPESVSRPELSVVGNMRRLVRSARTGLRSDGVLVYADRLYSVISHTESCMLFRL